LSTFINARQTSVANGADDDDAAALLTTSSTQVAAHWSQSRCPHVSCAWSTATKLRWHAVHSCLPPAAPPAPAPLAPPAPFFAAVDAADDDDDARASRFAARFARRLETAAPMFVPTENNSNFLSRKGLLLSPQASGSPNEPK
jgi:hypothetical protein